MQILRSFSNWEKNLGFCHDVRAQSYAVYNGGVHWATLTCTCTGTNIHASK